jgi:large subunit ribosomal protein L13
MKYVVDAQGKAIGRTASSVAILLMGKNDPSYEKNKVSANKVEIINASKSTINLKNLTAKRFLRYSGHPGGLLEQKMEDVIAKKGYAELFRLAIYGMLPGNKLRPKMMKNLTIVE